MKTEEVKAKDIGAVEELTDLPVAEDEAAETKGGETATEKPSKASPKLLLH